MVLNRIRLYKSLRTIVFEVIKFAKDHANPIRRSAFTFCEDELPSMLDLGKDKYGGPFTNEEVENVKAFVGILCVLLTMGPTFIADIAVNEILPSIVKNDYDPYMYNNLPTFTSFIYCTDCLTPLIVVVLNPVCLFLLRPFFHDCIPGMLKRMGLGMIMFFLSSLCTLLMGSIKHDCTTAVYDRDYSLSCSVIWYLKINPHFLMIQSSLNAIGYMLFNVATFEFICA